MKKLTFTKNTLIQTAFMAGILFLSSCGYDQNQNDTKNTAEEKNDEKFENNKQEKDAQFLVNAAEMNLEEIQLGKMAQQNGRTTHVRELGKKMEDAHSKSHRDLTALAKSKGISIPSSATNNSQEAFKKINNKSGADFDKAYADMMVEKHKDAIDKFEKAAEESNDIDIKNWAKSKLPDLRAHLNHSIECQKKCDKKA